jgi:eukaryotic-like serine/threonine-protein kinase
MTEPVPGESDPALFEVFDRYVSLLQQGDHEGAGVLLEANPRLAELAHCLDALDQFAEMASGRAAPGVAIPVDGARRRSEGGDGVDGSNDSLPDDSAEFGKYELLEEIGRGGMGVVFKARQRDLNRIVALKMILSSQLAADDDVKRFYREARAAGRLRHPHIVGIHEVGQVCGQHYFAMEYVAGRSLARILRQGPLDAEQAARCLLEVVRAVSYLHAHGVIHRDLKPSNVLIDERGCPFVTDFGLAKIFQEDDDRTKSGVILGTPGYMSPEQAAGRVSEISAQSDIYSLGAILYEMLCGRPPFRDDNPLNTILQVLESEPTRPALVNSRVPAELERICLRCLEKSPARRYQGASALAVDLEHFLRKEPLETQPVGVVDKLRRWVRRETGLVARLAILGAAATIIEVQHLLSARHWSYHYEIKFIFVAWTLMALWLQRSIRRGRAENVVRYFWAVLDPALLTIVLNLAEDDIGPLMIGYPLILTASGLWFRVRLVVVSTVAAIVCFTTLLYLRHDPTTQPHYPVIFATALTVIGWIVGFQVHRVRTLSRYFEQSQWSRTP